MRGGEELAVVETEEKTNENSAFEDSDRPTARVATPMISRKVA